MSQSNRSEIKRNSNNLNPNNNNNNDNNVLNTSSSSSSLRKRIKYFIFPDKIIPSAYPLIDGYSFNTQLINSDSNNNEEEDKEKIIQIARNIFDYTEVFLEPNIFKSFIDNKTREYRYLLIYPNVELSLFDRNRNRNGILSSENLNDLWKLVGLFQFLMRTRPRDQIDNIINQSTIDNQKNIKVAQRIFPGSPHSFYQWLITLKNLDLNSKVNKQNQNPNQNFFTRFSIHFQFTHNTPEYPNSDVVSNSRLYAPLENQYNTMLIMSNSGSPRPNSNIGSSNMTYCGDDWSKWQEAYKNGKAGTYDKCLQLFFRQFPAVLDELKRNDQDHNRNLDFEVNENRRRQIPPLAPPASGPLGGDRSNEIQIRDLINKINNLETKIDFLTNRYNNIQEYREREEKKDQDQNQQILRPRPRPRPDTIQIPVVPISITPSSPLSPSSPSLSSPITPPIRSPISQLPYQSQPSQSPPTELKEREQKINDDIARNQLELMNRQSENYALIEQQNNIRKQVADAARDLNRNREILLNLSRSPYPYIPFSS
jgi:hypothetical protein